MLNEKQKLLVMLRENKITKEDYQLLINSIKTSEGHPIYAWFINPFQKIAGIKSVILGLLVLVTLSATGVVAGVYYPSILDCLNASAMPYTNAIKPNFSLLLIQNIVNWLALSLVFYLVSISLKQRRIRLIDFLGTVAVSRFPYIVLSLLIVLVWKIDPKILNFDSHINTEFHFHFSVINFMINFMWEFCYAWQITTYLFSLKESSGLNGTKLWVGFVISLILGVAISGAINNFYMYK